MSADLSSRLPYFSSTTTQFSQLTLLSDSQEQVERGTADFPCCAYICDFSKLHSGIYPLHWHSELQITVARSHPLIVNVSGESVLLSPGEGILINTKVYHSIAAANPGECERLDVIFQPRLLYGSHDNVFYHKYLSPILKCRDLPYVKLDSGTSFGTAVLEYFYQAFDACRQQPFGFEILVRNVLSCALLLICQNFAEVLHTDTSSHKLREQRVRVMVNYIYSHYTEPLSLKEIAASASISERECFRCFNEVLNMPPVNFLKRHRIAAAVSLLENSSTGIADIGYQCGFNTPSYFIKTFKEFTGHTPREYQQIMESSS